VDSHARTDSVDHVGNGRQWRWCDAIRQAECPILTLSLPLKGRGRGGTFSENTEYMFNGDADALPGGLLHGFAECVSADRSSKDVEAQAE
jgi:hypothetical protein